MYDDGRMTTATRLSPAERILAWTADASPGHDFTDTALAERLDLPAEIVRRICSTMADEGELWGRRTYGETTAYVTPCPTVCRRCSTCEAYGPGEPAPRRRAERPAASTRSGPPVLPNLLRWIDRQTEPWSRRQAFRGACTRTLPESAALQPYLDRLVTAGVVEVAGVQPAGSAKGERTGPKYRLYQAVEQ